MHSGVMHSHHHMPISLQHSQTSIGPKGGKSSSIFANKQSNTHKIKPKDRRQQTKTAQSSVIQADDYQMAPDTGNRMQNSFLDAASYNGSASGQQYHGTMS